MGEVYYVKNLSELKKRASALAARVESESNQTDIADKLGISRTQMWRLLIKQDLTRKHDGQWLDRIEAALNGKLSPAMTIKPSVKIQHVVNHIPISTGLPAPRGYGEEDSVWQTPDDPANCFAARVLEQCGEFERGDVLVCEKRDDLHAADEEMGRWFVVEHDDHILVKRLWPKSMDTAPGRLRLSDLHFIGDLSATAPRDVTKIMAKPMDPDDVNILGRVIRMARKFR